MPNGISLLGYQLLFNYHYLVPMECLFNGKLYLCICSNQLYLQGYFELRTRTGFLVKKPLVLHKPESFIASLSVLLKKQFHELL